MGSQSLLKDSVVSFFKVMIDHDFLSILYLPPKFARATPGLLGKKTYLENLNGRRWSVMVSEKNGSMVFRKGWSEFSTAHKLGIGDFVLFHYFLDQVFIVQVFNKSACDLRGFALANGYPSKRSQSETIEVDTEHEDSPGNVDSNDSVISASGKENVHMHKEKNASEMHPLAVVAIENVTAEPTNYEDPQVQFLMIARETINEKRDEGRVVIDLSNYEIPSADAERNIQLTGYKRSLPFSNTVKCEVEPDTTELSSPKQEMKCHFELSESTKQKENGRSLYSDVKKKKYDVPTIGSPSSTALSFQHDSAELKVTVPKSVNRSKQCGATFQTGNAADKIKNEVKTEPFVETGLVYETSCASDLHCRIKNATSLSLELPGSLPLFTSRNGESGHMMVLLQDPAKRVWPVQYYHEPTRKYFTTGWSAFVKANNIQLGNECIFKADTNTAATYDVTIVRKSNKPINLM